MRLQRITTSFLFAAGALCAPATGWPAATSTPHPVSAPFSAPLASSSARPDYGRTALMATELAREFAEGCPFAEPQDKAALARCKAALFQPRSALRAHLAPFVLWGRMRVPDPVLAETHLTQFGPDVFTGTYAPLFMFNGQYTIRFLERENLYRIDFVAAFRNRLAPGLYPYPFWHEAEKWSIYQGTNRLSVYVGVDAKAGTEKIKVMQFSTFGEPHANVPAPIALPEFEKDTHARWLWTDKDGKTQPQVTLFDGLYSAANPHLRALDETYRAMALEFRDGDCMSCHVPSNPDKMKRLVLLQTPAHASSEVERVIASVREDRMPLDEFGLEKPMPESKKQALLVRAEAFQRALQAAREWEKLHAQPARPARKAAAPGCLPPACRPPSRS